MDIEAILNETQQLHSPVNQTLWANNAGIIDFPVEDGYILQFLGSFYFLAFAIGFILQISFLVAASWTLHKISRYQYLIVSYIWLSILDLMQLFWGLAAGVTIIRNTWCFGLIPCYAIYVFETFSKTLPLSFLLLICFEHWGLMAKAFQRCQPYTRILCPMALLTFLVSVYEADLFYRNVQIVESSDGRKSCEISLDLDGRRVQSWISLICYFLGPLILLAITNCLSLIPRSVALSDPISRMTLVLLFTRFLVMLPLWTYETLVEASMISQFHGEIIFFFFAQVLAFLPAGFLFPFIYVKIIQKLMWKEQLEAAGFEYSELSQSGASINLNIL